MLIVRLCCRGVQGVKFSVGSAWVPVPAGQETFEILDSATQAQLATATGSPPRSPGAATLYLYGVELTGTAAKLLSDAPERGANAGVQALKTDDPAEEHGAAQESSTRSRHRPSSVGVWIARGVRGGGRGADECM